MFVISYSCDNYKLYQWYLFHYILSGCYGSVCVESVFIYVNRNEDIFKTQIVSIQNYMK